jgi:transposase-like protein
VKYINRASQSRGKNRFSPQQIKAILRAIIDGRAPSVSALCHKHGISRNCYYIWKKKYGVPDQHSIRIDRLEREIASLRHELQHTHSRLAGLQQTGLPVT